MNHHSVLYNSVINKVIEEMIHNENQPASQEPKNKVRMALQEESCRGEKRVSEIDRRLYNR